MSYTIFNTPVINTLLRQSSLAVLKITGWRTHGRFPPISKYVLIGAPHTSNWDLPYALMIVFALRAEVCWMGKDAIFSRPFNGFSRWLGGIPVDRSKSSNVVTQVIRQFRKNKKLVLLIAPSGTRKQVSAWKTGFYYIAAGAGVPIVAGFLDYGRRVGGIGPIYQPTGDAEGDIKRIRAFYAGIVGKRSV